MLNKTEVEEEEEEGAGCKINTGTEIATESDRDTM